MVSVERFSCQRLVPDCAQDKYTPAYAYYILLFNLVAFTSHAVFFFFFFPEQWSLKKVLCENYDLASGMQSVCP